MDLLKPTGMKISAVDEIRQKNRGSPLKDHLSMVADGVQTLSWIQYSSKPADTASELAADLERVSESPYMPPKSEGEAEAQRCAHGTDGLSVRRRRTEA